MFQNLPLPAAQDVLDSSSGVTPCIVVKKDGVLYHLLPSFSPERWTTVVLQDCVVVGSDYRLVQYYLINVIRLNEQLNFTFRSYCVGRTFFGRVEPGYVH